MIAGNLPFCRVARAVPQMQCGLQAWATCRLAKRPLVGPWPAKIRASPCGPDIGRILSWKTLLKPIKTY